MNEAPAIIPGASISNVSFEEGVGAAIRRSRQQRSLKLSDVADAAGISVAMLSRIEHGQSVASLTLLGRICASLGVDLSSLIADVEQAQAKGAAELLKAADQTEVVRAGTKHGHTYRLLSHLSEPGKAFEPCLVKMDKNSEAYLRFQHPGTEFIYMLEGRMAYRVGEATFVLEPGDAFTFSASVLHGPEEILDDRVLFLSVIA
ncbi:XRE family transcriptional regulator [Methyloligella sp. 2.7D]|uniref:helix-turn-helix domain-containing protein n=1 Tax=unclassified Methyloligella TaxID=2625955 RepID=UPI00157BD922|nr:XRE family transcriptional regulator [Methyloligella sp. GL2]QKP78243.1 helix-turn-helix transcriptional regulator [Methyloligella sp. GL2]